MTGIKRRVVRAESREETQTDVQGREQTVQLWRCHLACGHYVDLSKRKRKMWPKAFQCSPCAHGHVPAEVK